VHCDNDNSNSVYMTARQVRQHFGGVSAMWIVRRLRDAGFPRPIKFADGRFAPRFWKRADVERWVSERGRRSAS
jgi:predicted DNA-binding transcriptional regulator AlpA